MASLFCTTLRRRASFSPAIPSLISAPDLQLKESRLESHDIAIRLPSAASNNRQLRLLLLSPAAVATTRLPKTLERIERFVALTGGSDLAIAFLFQPLVATTFMTTKQVVEGIDTAASSTGSQAFASLQARLADRTDIPHVPLLPLSNLKKLPDLLRRHKTNLQRPAPTNSNQPYAHSNLLKHCSAAPPLPDSALFFVANAFTSYRDLAQACMASGLASPESSSPHRMEAMSSRGMQIQTLSQIEAGSIQTIAAQSDGSESEGLSKLQHLRLLVGEEQYQNIVQFWQEEWVLE